MMDAENEADDRDDFEIVADNGVDAEYRDGCDDLLRGSMRGAPVAVDDDTCLRKTSGKWCAVDLSAQV